MSKIEGIPDGWELVRIGTPVQGERFVNDHGYVSVCNGGYHKFEFKNYVIVRKIEPAKPVYVPWTYETCPVGLLVKVRVGKQKGLITGAGEDRARIGSTSRSYDCLLSDWIQLDGTPCGTILEAT